MVGESGFELLSSGIPGLDSLLHGGFITGRMYLVRGKPGTGKSLLGQHFLEVGLENRETVVYIHGEETRTDILTNARQLGIDLNDARFLDLGPETDFFTEDISYNLVEPSDVESERFIDDIKEAIDGSDPDRIFIDPITQLQHLEPDEYQYRKRLLALMRFLRKRDTTVLGSRTRSQEKIDEHVESLTDGIVDLSRGEGGRRVTIPKHRGLGQQDGTHGLEIRADGIEVYPQLMPNRQTRTFDPELLPSGLPRLDALLGGGIERGSVTFFSGPSGIGKSTIGTHFAAAAGSRGENTLIYLFEESEEELLYRTKGMDIPIATLREQGTVVVREIEPLVRSAEEVAQMIQRDIDDHDPALVMIDGMSGYKVSLQGDNPRLTDRLHALTRTLKYQGIAVCVMDEISQLTGIPSATSANTSYIADNLLIMSYLERNGGLDRLIGVLKKRLGNFESQFRSFSITDEGVTVGEPLTGTRTVLGGSSNEDA